LKSIFSLLNLAQYSNTDEVLAVPEPPINKQQLLHKVLLGYLRIKSSKSSALNESKVGNSN